MAILMQDQIEKNSQQIADSRAKMREEAIAKAYELRDKVLETEAHMKDLLDTAFYLVVNKVVSSVEQLLFYKNLGSIASNSFFFRCNREGLYIDYECWYDYQHIYLKDEKLHIKCVESFNGRYRDFQLDSIVFESLGDYYIKEATGLMRVYLKKYDDFNNNVMRFFERVTK